MVQHMKNTATFILQRQKRCELRFFYVAIDISIDDEKSIEENSQRYLISSRTEHVIVKADSTTQEVTNESNLSITEV
jgi:hypothetical protein